VLRLVVLGLILIKTLKSIRDKSSTKINLRLNLIGLLKP